jgi:hypothetical protein
MVPGPANTPEWWIWELLTGTASPPTNTNPNERKNMPKSKQQNSVSVNLLSDQRIVHYLQAGYPGLYIVSPEEQRVEAEIKAASEATKFGLHVWSASTGLLDTDKRSLKECNDPMELLLAVDELPERSVILMKDFHMFLQDPNPVLFRKLKDVLLMAKTKSKTLIVLACRLVLPPELEREFTILEFKLPGKDQLNHVLQGIVESAGLKPVAPNEIDQVLDAASGLTTIEAENAFALSGAFKSRSTSAIPRNSTWFSCPGPQTV